MLFVGTAVDQNHVDVTVLAEPDRFTGTDTDYADFRAVRGFKPGQQETNQAGIVSTRRCREQEVTRTSISASHSHNAGKYECDDPQRYESTHHREASSVVFLRIYRWALWQSFGRHHVIRADECLRRLSQLPAGRKSPDQLNLTSYVCSERWRRYKTAPGACRTQVFDSETPVLFKPWRARTDFDDFMHVNEVAHSGNM